ncbi:MAG: hypothetical protein KZQ88_05670 [Candidatus Thiodiazotropha sp. (ex Dulcina madagascariensis)]|nr:hypothetical protein [Candidatus Thiodiazotropha sp. (ex Dulcina madagascariensis)]MCU7927061.1 hypothetical protein [Candidatus Thiodiazotropha sp. (ex Dulcina madagascariensis)]
MKHYGIFDANRDPLKQGGLSSQDRQLLESKGWRKGVTLKLYKDVTVAFADSEISGLSTLRKVDVPEGVDYYYNPDENSVIFTDCGNPADDDFILPEPDTGSVPPSDTTGGNE